MRGGRAKFDSTGDLAACLDRISRGQQTRRALTMASEEGGAGPVPYAQPLLDAVSLFDRLGIRYALIGGVAAMYFGRARFTEDVDFVAATGHRELLEQNPQVMREFRFDPSCPWKLYHDSGVEIDIWKDPFGDDVAARAIDVDLAGRRVRVAEPHDLI